MAHGQAIMDQAKRESNFLRWFGGSKIVDGAGNPLIVYQGYDRAQVRPGSFHGCAYWTEKPQEASAYASVSVAFRGALQAQRAVERMIDPPAPFPRYFSAFESWPCLGDFAGSPLHYFTVDDAIYWPALRGNRVVPRLVKGWRVRFSGKRWDGKAVSGQSEDEQEIRRKARDTRNTPGAVVQAAYLRILRPFRSDSPQYVNQFSGRWGADTQRRALAELQRLKGLGYDGIIGPTDTMVYEHEDDDGWQETGDVYVTFSPNQAKSATGNSGDYSRRSGDIRNPAGRLR